MARVRVRYLIRRDGGGDRPPRWFWQPSSELRAAGFRPRRVPDDWRELERAGADPARLQAAAIGAAQALNAELDRWRAAPPAAPAAAATLPAARTVKTLIAAYLASHDYRSLAPKTRYEYGRRLRDIEEWCGDTPVAAMRTAQFTTFYEALWPKTPALAHAIMRVARLLFAYGRRQGWRSDNPAERLGLIGLEKSGRVWPREAVAAFIATADRTERHSIGTAVMLNEWLGQREADLLRLPRQLLGSRGLVLRQRKTGAGVALPIGAVPPLVARIEAELAAQHARGVTDARYLLLCETTGRPWGADHFRHEFAAVRDALAAARPRFAIDYLPAGAEPTGPEAFTLRTRDLWFMHLRHTAVVRLAEAGATIAGIATITGHSLKTVDTILEHYLVRTAPMAAAAFAQRLRAEDDGA